MHEEWLHIMTFHDTSKTGWAVQKALLGTASWQVSLPLSAASFLNLSGLNRCPKTSQKGPVLNTFSLPMRKLKIMVMIARLEALVLSFPEMCSAPISIVAHSKGEITWNVEMSKV